VNFVTTNLLKKNARVGIGDGNAGMAALGVVLVLTGIVVLL
jgi:hypothetical protein